MHALVVGYRALESTTFSLMPRHSLVPAGSESPNAV
jgi:hypothetical protein